GNDSEGMDFDDNDACCRVCGYEADDDNELVQCSQCKSRYHCQCHEPALRHPPRSSNWVCNTCRTGSGAVVSDDKRLNRSRARGQTKKTHKQKGQRGRKRTNNVNEDISHAGRTTRSSRKKREISDEEEETQEQSVENETVQRRSSKRLRKSDPKPFVYKPRRVRIEKSTSSSEPENGNPVSEESENENDTYHSSDTTSENENDIENNNNRLEQSSM
ncbi:unnamed protein product, partial [Didymodactylos carnosus]